MALVFLCPNCMNIIDYFIERVLIYEEQVILPDGAVEKGEVLESEHKLSVCPKCHGGFENWKAMEFLVKKENGKIITYGDYWVQQFGENKDITKEILKEKI